MNLYQKIERQIISLFVIVVMTVALSACSPQEKQTKTISNFSFDFKTGEYSFSGTEGAREYRVRIFPVSNDGTEEELPINESQPIRGGKESYSGTVPLWSLTAGNTYHAYVLTIWENGENSLSEAASGVYIAQYSIIESGVQATIADHIITVSLDGDALEDSFESGADYEIQLRNGDTLVETKTLKNSDIVVNKDESGPSASTTYDAKVTFEIAEDSADYSVTVKVISSSEYYISSEVSEPFAVTEEAAAPVDAAMGDMPVDGTPEEGPDGAVPSEGSPDEAPEATENSGNS